MCQQSLRVYLRYISPPERDTPRIYIPEAGSQLGDRTLTSPRSSHERRHLTLPSGEGDIVEHLLPLLIGKGDVIKSNIIATHRDLCLPRLGRHLIDLSHARDTHIQVAQEDGVVQYLLDGDIDRGAKDQEDQISHQIQLTSL